MIKAIRTLVLAVLILGGLGAATYLIYFSPRELERRVALEIGRYVRVRPSVAGARQGWMGPLRIERIGLPAAPVIEARQLLFLQGIEIDAVAEDWARLRLPRAQRRGSVEIRVERAEVAVEQEIVPERPGALTTRSAWNFQDLLQAGNDLIECLRIGHQLSAREVVVALNTIRRRQEKTSWSAAVEDLYAEGGEEGDVTARGELRAGPHWTGGHFQLELHPEAAGDQPSIELRGSLENLQGLDEWLASEVPDYARALEVLSPRGPVELALQWLRFFRPAGASGPWRLDYQARARHYDTLLTLRPLGLDVRHVVGIVMVDSRGVLLGASDSAEGAGALRGEIGGTEVEIAGRLAAGGGAIELRLPPTDLQGLSTSAFGGSLASTWRRLRPAGNVSGALTLQFGAAGLDRWKLQLAFRDLTAGGLPFLGPTSLKLDLEGQGKAGSGALTIESGRFAPFGDLRGSASLSWTEDQLVTSLTDIALGDGLFFGTIRHSMADGAIQGDVRWERVGLDFGGGLLAAGSTSGKIEISTVDGEPVGRVRMDLKDLRMRVDRLPKGAAPPGDGEAITLQEGTLAGTVAPGGVVALELALRDPRSALRLKGRLGHRGDLDAVGVLAGGEEARALNLLGLPSPPSDWRRAAGEGGMALRVRGDTQRSRVRRVEWSDPAFETP